jgi:hypothetical protein
LFFGPPPPNPTQLRGDLINMQKKTFTVYTSSITQHQTVPSPQSSV